MIKVNLAAERKARIGSSGLDLSLLNKRGLIYAGLAGLVWIAVSMYFDNNISDLSNQKQAIEQQKRKFDQKVKESKNIEDQIQQFEEKKVKLLARLNAVKNIVEQKRNPRDILHYIAKNVPKNVWIKSVSLQGNQLQIDGYSNEDDIADITFLKTRMDSSVFFKKSLELQGLNTVELKEPFKRKVMQFTMKGNVERFE